MRSKGLLIFLLFAVLSLGYGGDGPWSLYLAKVSKAGPEEAAPEETEPSTIAEDVGLPFAREHFYWRMKGRRDPFVPLIVAKGEKSPGLNINNVALVGTMWGPEGILALVTEKGGTGHVLKEGDKVAGGRVADITEDSLTFELSQFGIVTEVTFHLKGKE